MKVESLSSPVEAKQVIIDIQRAIQTSEQRGDATSLSAEYLSRGEPHRLAEDFPLSAPDWPL